MILQNAMLIFLMMYLNLLLPQMFRALPAPSSLPGSAKLHIVPHMGIYKAPHINVIIADVNNYVINITKDIIDISMNLADGRAGAIIYTLSLLNVILIITIYT